MISTGDPWIDAWITFRAAWIEGGTETELEELARELRTGLPGGEPSGAAAIFIAGDIVVISERHQLPRRVASALWTPSS